MSASRTHSSVLPSRYLSPGTGEVALGTIDDRRRDNLSRGLLEYILALVRQFEATRHAGGEFDHLVVEERNTSLQTPGHGHVVHAFDRVVDQHHRGVQTQRLVQAAAGARLGEVIADELAGIIFLSPLRHYGLAILIEAAIHEGFLVGAHRVACLVHLRIPVIASEDFIGPLAALHHLAVLGYFAGKQEEGDVVMADHRLVHRLEGVGQLGKDLLLGNHQLVMVRSEMLGNQIRVLELVAGLAV